MATTSPLGKILPFARIAGADAGAELVRHAQDEADARAAAIDLAEQVELLLGELRNSGEVDGDRIAEVESVLLVGRLSWSIAGWKRPVTGTGVGA